jgi:hypothetical protein
MLNFKINITIKICIAILFVWTNFEIKAQTKWEFVKKLEFTQIPSRIYSNDSLLFVFSLPSSIGNFAQNFVSKDGNTFSELNNNMQFFASSGKFCISSYPLGIMLSTNYGVTWSKKTSELDFMKINDISIDGKNILFATRLKWLALTDTNISSIKYLSPIPPETNFNVTSADAGILKGDSLFASTMFRAIATYSSFPKNVFCNISKTEFFETPVRLAKSNKRLYATNVPSYSDNFGIKWNQFTFENKVISSGLVCVNKDTICIFNSQLGVLMSYNSGKSFIKNSLIGEVPPIKVIDLVFHKNYIFALNSNGEIYRKKYRNFSTDVEIDQSRILINYSNNIIRINEYIDSLMIYNILGELVFETKEVNISGIQLGLNSGIYLVKANNQIYKIIVL